MKGGLEALERGASKGALEGGFEAFSAEAAPS